MIFLWACDIAAFLLINYIRLEQGPAEFSSNSNGYLQANQWITKATSRWGL